MFGLPLPRLGRPSRFSNAIFTGVVTIDGAISDWTWDANGGLLPGYLAGSLNVNSNLLSNVGAISNISVGATWLRGALTELITLSTSGATTDSTENLLPANSIIEAVVARVTTTITTATDWSLGDSAQANRFSAAESTLVAGTTKVGLNQANPTVASADLGPVQASAAKLRITTSGTPGAGVIRVVVFYRQFTAPTS